MTCLPRGGVNPASGGVHMMPVPFSLAFPLLAERERPPLAGCSPSRSRPRVDRRGERLARQLPLWAKRANLGNRPNPDLYPPWSRRRLRPESEAEQTLAGVTNTESASPMRTFRRRRCRQTYGTPPASPSQSDEQAQPTRSRRSVAPLACRTNQNS